MSQLDPVVVIALGDRCVLRAVLCARYMAEAVEAEMWDHVHIRDSLIIEPEKHWSMRALHPTTQEDTG